MPTSFTLLRFIKYTFYRLTSDKKAKGAYNRVRYFESERPHSHNIIIVYYYNHPILLIAFVNITVPNLYMKLCHGYLCMGKMVYIDKVQ